MQASQEGFIYLFIYSDLALDGNKFLQPTQNVKSLQTSTKHGQAPSKIQVEML